MNHYLPTYLILGFLLTLSNSTRVLADELNQVKPSVQRATSNTTSYNGAPVHYVSAGDPSKPGVLFVHGTPGEWSAFSSYLADPDLQRNYFMASIDRLGWGLSQPLPKSVDAKKFDQQAAAALAIMQRYPGKKWIVVGHSLGASIAPKVVVLAGGQVSGMLLLAGSINPALGKPRWYNQAASLLVVRWLLPKKLKYSNDEIMALRRELETLDQEIKTSQWPVDTVLIQGMQDNLVSPRNAAFVAQEWQGQFNSLRVIELPDAGHFLPWENADVIKKTLLEFSF